MLKYLVDRALNFRRGIGLEKLVFISIYCLISVFISDIVVMLEI